MFGFKGDNFRFILSSIITFQCDGQRFVSSSFSVATSELLLLFPFQLCVRRN